MTTIWFTVTPLEFQVFWGSIDGQDGFLDKSRIQYYTEAWALTIFAFLFTWEDIRPIELEAATGLALPPVSNLLGRFPGLGQRLPNSSIRSVLAYLPTYQFNPGIGLCRPGQWHTRDYLEPGWWIGGGQGGPTPPNSNRPEHHG